MERHYLIDGGSRWTDTSVLLAGAAQNLALGFVPMHISQWADSLRLQTPICALVNWGLANLHTSRKIQVEMERGSFWDKSHWFAER